MEVGCSFDEDLIPILPAHPIDAEFSAIRKDAGKWRKPVIPGHYQNVRGLQRTQFILEDVHTDVMLFFYHVVRWIPATFGRYLVQI